MKSSPRVAALPGAPAGPGQVSGGVGRNGWMPTGAKGERIVLDAGRPVANGRIEASFTADELPGARSRGNQLSRLA